MPLTAMADFSYVCRQRPWGSSPQRCPPSTTDRSRASHRSGAPPLVHRVWKPKVRSPVCSTDAIHHAGQRAIGGQFVRLSANSPRPERRSTDGQMILTVGPAGWKSASDLLVCGAPLRNHRRPSPYHLHLPRFTAPQGFSQAGNSAVSLLPCPAAPAITRPSPRSRTSSRRGVKVG